MQDLLAKFFQSISNLKQVAVLGDYFLDRYQIGEISRISPEAPVPILKHLRDEFRPGGAGNVIQNLTNLGIPASCLGLIGHDPEAKRLKSLLSDKLQANIRSLLTDADRPTSLKTRLIARNQQLMRIDREDTRPIDERYRSRLEETLTTSLPSSNLLLISDYGKGVIYEGLITKIRKQYPDLWISVDPKGNTYQKYIGANLITPNQKEAEEATGMKIQSEEDVVRSLHFLYEITQAPYICMTRSEKGMILFEGESKRLTCQSSWSQREVFDVTGAGDTVLVFVSLGLSKGIDPQATLKIASLAAFLVIQKFGASGVTLHEMVQGCDTKGLSQTLVK